VLEPLIEGLKARGFCFETLREHPAYRRLAGLPGAESDDGPLIDWLARRSRPVRGGGAAPMFQPAWATCWKTASMPPAGCWWACCRSRCWCGDRPAAALWPVEPVRDRAAMRTDMLYTLMHRLGLFRVALFFTVDPLGRLFGQLRVAGRQTFSWTRCGRA
jgi:hypothetical protein